MKFLVKSNILASSLKPALDTATKGIVKEFSDANKITIKAEKGKLLVKAFGGFLAIDLSITDTSYDGLTYSNQKEGEVTVRAVDFISSLQSFEDNTMVNIELLTQNGGKELIIAKKEDAEEYQTLPVFDNAVTPPIISQIFDKEIKINRNIFISAANKIFFSVGIFQHQEKFLYWMLRADKNKSQFAAGSGSRFAVLSLSGNNFVDVKDAVNILMPKEPTPVVLGILSAADCEYITIKQSVATNSTPDQIIINFDGNNLILVGFNPSIKWVDEDKFFKMDKAHKFITNIREWEYAARGIRATYNDEIRKENQVHKADLHFNMKDKVLIVKTETTMKSSRKISLLDTSSTNASLSFDASCVSQYVAEIPKYFDSTGNVQIEIINDKAPIIVHDYATDKVNDKTPQKVNDATGIAEEFSIYFAVMAD